MNKLIDSYNIDFYKFKNLIHELDAIITGSFALAGFLIQEKIDVGYQPNDIDIFVADYQTEKLYNFIESFGYKKIENDVENYLNTEMEDYIVLKEIHFVTTFINRDGKKIQVIAVKSNNILEYIKKNFDLSVCITWYNLNKNTFETINPELTKKKEMYINSPFLITKKLLERIEKYKQRGFTIINL